MIPLPPKIDASVTMMQVEEKPDVTYSDVGGCKEQIEKLREVVETPLLNVRTYFLLLKHAHIVDSPRNSSNLELTPPKVSCCTVPQVQARHCVHAR
jgi:SpoVK/Ycf46/Vps4 family AAA+-type ATPase